MLEFQNLSKAFPGVQALSDVSFAVTGGSVHALCGENGAGKSTLLKILSGMYKPDTGQLVLEGQPLRFGSPFDAIKAGIAVIYQELHLVPEMTVAENVFLGHLPSRTGWVDKRNLVMQTASKLEELGIALDPNAKVGELSLAQRQMVEIAKALSRDAKVIAFDEPTSSLSAREVETLFAIIEKLKRQEKAILYVSHRMDEIFSICDTVTVLRDGKHIETISSAQTDAAGVVKSMVGRDIADIWGWRPRTIGRIVLDSHGLKVSGGEILGIFGLVGAGRTELLKEIYANPAQSIKNGICLCPEDRKKEGIVPVRSVAENINLSARRRFSKLSFWINEPAERENATQQVEAMRVKTPNLEQQIGLLSGGNQQKAILGRWLSEDVKVLLLDEPTRGIDVGAKREIYDIL
ncbi:MAG: ATP-binding cassette domain-containing protein, partial [Armatimonadetes bacterium]|nr:ATP-binding cassette domain-containing protein [Armatimonadota bacterium]